MLKKQIDMDIDKVIHLYEKWGDVVFAYLLFVNLFISNPTMSDMFHSVVTSLL